MADLPRWVPSPRVDSQAMLSAFLYYKGRCHPSEQEALAALHGIGHAVQDTINVAGIDIMPTTIRGPVPMTPCTAAGCRRCVDRRGGYQFRWYSRHWEEAYRRTRRPGSWLPGEPEQDIDSVTAEITTNKRRIETNSG